VIHFDEKLTAYSCGGSFGFAGVAPSTKFPLSLGIARGTGMWRFNMMDMPKREAGEFGK
jgi:hypothetical protein